MAVKNRFLSKRCYWKKDPMLIRIGLLHTRHNSHGLLLNENVEFSKCNLSHTKALVTKWKTLINYRFIKQDDCMLQSLRNISNKGSFFSNTYLFSHVSIHRQHRYMYLPAIMLCHIVHVSQCNFIGFTATICSDCHRLLCIEWAHHNLFYTCIISLYGQFENKVTLLTYIYMILDLNTDQ